jgi:hypothetical protein
MNSIVRTIALSLTLTFLTLSAARAAVPNDVNATVRSTSSTSSASS